MLRLAHYVGDAPAMQPTANRRRFERRTIDGLASATVVTPEGDRVLTGVVYVDRSHAGLGVRSPVEIPVGSSVMLHIDGVRVPGRGGRCVYCAKDPSGGWRVGLDCAAEVAVA